MNPKESANDALAQMFAQMQAQWGNVAKAFWFSEEEACPGCGREIDAMKHKGKDALSLNVFIYRKTGVLIGYFLCGRCAKAIFRDAKQNPGVETWRHAAIEKNLIAAYHKHMNSMDA